MDIARYKILKSKRHIKKTGTLVVLCTYVHNTYNWLPADQLNQITLYSTHSCVYTAAATNMSTIVSDDDIFVQFTNEASRKQYERMWKQFLEFCGDFDLEAGQPGEDLLTNYFKHLRFEKKMASSSLWTVYSCLNSILKRKFSAKLQELRTRCQTEGGHL